MVSSTSFHHLEGKSHADEAKQSLGMQYMLNSSNLAYSKHLPRIGCRVCAANSLAAEVFGRRSSASVNYCKPNQFLDAADEKDVSILVEASLVARAEPSIAKRLMIRRRNFCRRHG